MYLDMFPGASVSIVSSVFSLGLLILHGFRDSTDKIYNVFIYTHICIIF